MPTQSSLIRTVVGATAMLVGSVALVLLGASFGLSVATARPDIVFTEQTVNRVGKADRLDRASARQAIDPAPASRPSRTLVPDARLAAGCESLVSPLTQSALARI